ncbi:hypothetical protein BDV25DRAFT_140393 [Aspergillus avenaceus]|uniref:Zn(2)-C6 fungal-type domain-containing protein n=1 Tax=Aspergillus avenaceus TaxID=36643 RepID=A0A5N6TU23_ASPAV|nr:hypothetical protein BDV25DRAFT_140393 [Aspergillus avenaceus]
MTKSRGERLYRACIRCRQRKTKCDLQYVTEYDHQPCSKCSAEGHKCVVATSRRGGDYSRFRIRRGHRESTPQRDLAESSERGRKGKVTVPEPIVPDHALGGVQNPLEALQILAQTASSDRCSRRDPNMAQMRPDEMSLRERGTSLRGIMMQRPSGVPSVLDSELIRDGIVELQLLVPLLQYYFQNFHSYLPIVPSHLVSLEDVERSWATETFLLTAVLTIATKDRSGLESLHKRILAHMEKLLLRVVLGYPSVRHISSVEGLLLLAEWVPHINHGAAGRDDVGHYGPSNEVHTTEENSVAWSVIGLAVRQAYLLHLERYSFRGDAKDVLIPGFHRNRLAWIFTYLADRQISIQMGQAFWCRGPGLSTRFTTEDYPDLRPQKRNGIDYASSIQAQVELTTIFGNIHDILYASKTRTVQLMLMGDYTKYLDDSSKALDMWKETWGSTDLPSHLSGLLSLQFEYLRLYINAFAFQAVLYRSPRSPSGSEHSKTSYFPFSVMASADGRHIYIAIDAAKGVLKHLIERLNPTKHFRFLPMRFYLYEIHAAVFLFKAFTVGALNSEEQQNCFSLVRQFISMLKVAATDPSHIASRYGKLLAGLWFQGQLTPEAAPDIAQPDASIHKSSLNHVDIDEVTDASVIESIGSQPQLSDEFSTFPMMPFLEPTEALDCPDVFLSNLPFLREGFPELDIHGAGQLLMDL